MDTGIQCGPARIELWLEEIEPELAPYKVFSLPGTPKLLPVRGGDVTLNPDWIFYIVSEPDENEKYVRWAEEIKSNEVDSLSKEELRSKVIAALEKLKDYHKDFQKNA